MKINLTDAEVNVTLTALYERLTETKSYIRATRLIVDGHKSHGANCCAVGTVTHQRECLAGFEERLAAISSAIDKLEGIA